MKMTFKFNKNDRRLLARIAEYRMVTVSQITAIQCKSKQVVRRRLNMLEKAEYIHSSTAGFGSARGRPEKVISLSEKGASFLRYEHETLRDVPLKKMNAEQIPCREHQLLTNWFRIHLEQIERTIPQLEVDFLSPSSPFLKQNRTDLPFVFEPPPSEGRLKNSGGFTPDGVFCIAHKERQMTLLFFLEVDMGTETLASPQRTPNDVRQKIINYQQLFRNNGYKRYQEYWNCKLHGFRLLFLTNSNARLAALSRLVQEMPPSNFIWLTSVEPMFSSGLSAEIWVAGGDQDALPKSILGNSMAFKSPIPSPKP